jgi:hypothetical protein
MKIFELQADSNNYRGLTDISHDASNMSVTDNTNLNRVSATWEPLKLKFSGKGKVGDCPSFLFFLPIFSEKAISSLNHLMFESVEYLPVICPGKVKYFAVNVLKVVDCIDHSKSDAIRFDDGRVMKFKKYAFKKELLQGAHIFKIPDFLFSRIFVSEEFVNKANESGLLGFDFIGL